MYRSSAYGTSNLQAVHLMGLRYESCSHAVSCDGQWVAAVGTDNSGVLLSWFSREVWVFV
jgi:hypothetical protein